MSQTSAPTAPLPAAAPRSLREPTGNARRRRLTERALHLALLGAVAAAVVPLVLILWQVAVQGGQAISWEFLTQVEPFSYRERGGGYAHGIVGTLYMVGIATALTVPLGVAAAVYLVEYGGRSAFATVVRFFTDVMTGIPSIFAGLAIYAILVTQIGFGTLVGAVALGVLMLPIIVRSSEEMLSLVPAELRNASYGLGARRWQTTLQVALPAAAPGLVTGCMLAVARAAGETAPLILTALGARAVVTAVQGAPQASVGLLMLDGMTQPFEPGIERAWAGGLTLIALVLALTVAARLISARQQV